MGFIMQNVYLFALAMVLALLEVQIEGKHGWARALPTWRPSGNLWFARWYKRIMHGKELTGYHLVIFGFVLLIFHLPFAFGLPFTWERWLHTLSLYFLFVVVWDFLWFVLNPHHPLSHFVGVSNPVHVKFFGPVPVDYYGSALISFLVLLPLVWRNSAGVVGWWLANVTLFVLQTLLVTWFSLKVLNIDSWYRQRPL